MANALTDGLSLPDEFETSAIQATEIGSGAVMTYNISGGQVVTGKIATNIAIAGTTGSVVVPHLAASTGSLVVLAGTSLTSSNGSVVIMKDLDLSHNLSVLDIGSVVLGTIVPPNGSLVFGAGATLTTPTGSLTFAKDLDLTHNLAVTGSVAAASVTVSSGQYVPFAVGGSPASTAALVIQGGSATTDAGSDAFVAFPILYSAAPVSFVASASETEGTTFNTAALHASGATLESSAAEQYFNWIAIGPE